VQTPFAAPPSERDRKRLWIGLGLGAVLLVLCCGGGAFGIGALVVNRTNALRTEAVSVVGQYLSDLRAQNYPAAFGLLCTPLRDRLGQARFTSQQRQSRVTDFTIGTASISGTQVLVPATVQTADGRELRRVYALVEEEDPAGLRICAGE